MSLTLHRAARADVLADALAGELAVPPDDPFAMDLVLVGARGTERWLSQRLSHTLGAQDGADGVCAGVELRPAGALIGEVGGRTAEDPWAPDRLVWTLLQVIDASAGQPWSAPLDRHLGRAGRILGEPDGQERREGRRYALAHRLCRLFAGYATHRPALLRDWEAGRDTDGMGAPIDHDLQWQPHLWRELVEQVDADSPVVRHDAAIRALREACSPLLPQRFSLFGHTRIPVSQAEILGALAEHHRISLWLPHPSETLWQALTDLEAVVPRRLDDSHRRVQNRLLASLGRDLRELQRTLSPVVTDTVTWPVPPTPVSLLGHLQSDLRANSAAARRAPIDGDDSVRIHACHGQARQVEVLREQILGLLADDPTLEPRDVIVMCPDIETYAPLIEACFGAALAAGSHPAGQLQVRLADRSLVQTNPLLDVIGRLLDLAGGRAEASTVLDLLATAPVRTRFGLSEDDLDTLTGWVGSAGVRWAFDADHRSLYGLADHLQNTWRFGLDRILTGVAVSDDAHTWFGPTLPLDDVGSTDIDLAGRLAEALDRIQRCCDALSDAHPAEHWHRVLSDALAGLTAVPAADAWMTAQAHRELAALLPEQPGSSSLRLPDVRAALADRLAGRPSRANFRTGSITVCTMVPMRSVPHRVVCLLGLDDGAFPRSASPDGDDVLVRRPLTGERDGRSEDRQLLLDAICSTTDHLVITYTGAHEVSGAERPPSVPLGELIDTLAVVTGGDLGQVLVRHPLAAHDPRNLVEGGLGVPGIGSFDPMALAGALAARAPRVEVSSPADVVLEPPPVADVDLADLSEFLRHPVKYFWKRRLVVALPSEPNRLSDAMAIELDGLQTWQVGERMLADLRGGRAPDQALQAEWRRGALPPGRLGWRMVQQILRDAVPIAAEADRLTDGRSLASVDVDVDLGGGRRLRGTVTDVHDDRVVIAGFSRPGPRHHLDAWLPVLALGASSLGTEYSAGVIGRGSGNDTAGRISFGPVPAEQARGLLSDLVDLFDLGAVRPLPLPLKTGFAISRSGPERADADWSGKGSRFADAAENRDPFHVATWGEDAPLQGLVEAGLPDLARRLWTPIRERVVLA